jgi:DNA-binding transcriptional MerR regulator
MSEKIIHLDKIVDDGTIYTWYKLIGISLEEWNSCLREIPKKISIKAFRERLGFSLEELKEAVDAASLKPLKKPWKEGILRTDVIKMLWSKKTKDEITLQEFVETAILVSNVDIVIKAGGMVTKAGISAEWPEIDKEELLT